MTAARAASTARVARPIACTVSGEVLTGRRVGRQPRKTRCMADEHFEADAGYERYIRKDEPAHSRDDAGQPDDRRDPLDHRECAGHEAAAVADARPTGSLRSRRPKQSRPRPAG